MQKNNARDMDYEKSRALIQRMKLNGNLDDIIEGLTHVGSIVRMNAIMDAAQFSRKDSKIIELIKGLKNDNTTLSGYSISDFAIAALDVLGAEKYNGDKEQVIALINSKFKFE